MEDLHEPGANLRIYFVPWAHAICYMNWKSITVTDCTTPGILYIYMYGKVLY